jgi:hypothetical protein
MSVKKRVLPNYVDKKLQVFKMSKLQIFVITNICIQVFVTFDRIGTVKAETATVELAATSGFWRFAPWTLCSLHRDRQRPENFFVRFIAAFQKSSSTGFARFFWAQSAKMGEMYQRTIKYIRWP